MNGKEKKNKKKVCSALLSLESTFCTSSPACVLRTSLQFAAFAKNAFVVKDKLNVSVRGFVSLKRLCFSYLCFKQRTLHCGLALTGKTLDTVVWLLQVRHLTLWFGFDR